MNKLLATIAVGAVILGGTACGSSDSPATAVTVTAEASPAPTVTETTAAPSMTTPAQAPEPAVDNDRSLQMTALQLAWDDFSSSDQDDMCTIWLIAPDRAIEALRNPDFDFNDDVTERFFEKNCN